MSEAVVSETVVSEAVVIRRLAAAPRRPRRLLARALPILGVIGACALAGAPAAWAHAQLLDTSPAAGSTVQAQPGEVIFEFNQAVGGTVGAVRVYGAEGREVDDLNVSHPDGRQSWIGVGLEPRLPDGTYTGTYRVISADTHIVYGGLVFNIGHAGATPKFTVAGLIGRNKSGEVTAIAFGFARGLNYLSLALMLGGLAFLAFAWTPGLLALADPSEQRWLLASHVFATRMRRLLVVAILIGLLASVLGVLLQGASAAGVSLWASLKGTIISDTLHSRFGEVWGLRAIDWALIGGLLLAGSALGRGVMGTLVPTSPGDEPATLTAGDRATLAAGDRATLAAGDRATLAAGDRATLAGRPPPAAVALLGVCVAYLAITPALAGHASIESPVAVFFPSDVLHVLAASVWVGGIACLLLVLPGATRRVEGAERSRLLLVTLARFSPLALAAVVTIAVTGVLQAYIDVRNLNALFHSTYGLLLLVKTGLLIALIGFGWINRERVIPALRRLTEGGLTPGGVGVLARRSMRGELTLMLCVFGVTAALISYRPPIDAASGPFATATTIGPAELQMTLDPARVGLNTVHLYLFNAKDGSQFTATKELTVTAELPSKGIGPLPLKANLSGPGHYTLNAAELTPGGTWEIHITDRVSAFDEYTKTVKVPIR